MAASVVGFKRGLDEFMEWGPFAVYLSWGPGADSATVCLWMLVLREQWQERAMPFPPLCGFSRASLVGYCGKLDTGWLAGQLALSSRPFLMVLKALLQEWAGTGPKSQVICKSLPPPPRPLPPPTPSTQLLYKSECVPVVIHPWKFPNVTLQGYNKTSVHSLHEINIIV